MLKNKKNSIFNTAYITGESLDCNLLWMIPFLDGLNKSLNIKRLIFDKKLNSFPFNNKSTKKILDKYQIFENSYTARNYFNKFFLKLKILFYYFIQIAKFIFFFDKKKVLKKDWYELQLYHSYWDSCLISMNDNQSKPNFFQKLKNAILICETIDNFLKIKDKLAYVFLAHTVYKYRTIFALCRKFNIKVFTSANFNIQIQKKNSDTAWNFLNYNKFINLQKSIPKKTINNYWSKRLKGKSTYEDARIASKIKNNYNNYPKNVILLHIFKDSPFNVIDRERIFFDYFDWIKKTIDIINTSNEKWAIRLHPNYKRWGEDQKRVLKNIINKKIKNFLIDDRLISNNQMFEEVKRVVTFSGTSHLEASCFGIKPIVISDVMLGKLNKKFIFKPKNYLEYKKLLLQKSNHEKFKQSKKVINISRTALYIRENLLSMKDIIKLENTYKNDNLKKIDKKTCLKILNRIRYINEYMLKKGQSYSNLS
jgi:hypothetical protein